jgi:hypothetical protein
LNRLQGLVELRLEGTPIQDKNLVGLRGVKALQALNLAHTRITGEGLFFLSEQRDLMLLNLEGSDVTDDGLQQIVLAPALTDLNLCGTRIAFTKVPDLKDLRHLTRIDLRGAKVGDVVWKQLTQLRSLQLVVVAPGYVSSTGQAAFQKAVPDCRVLSRPVKDPAPPASKVKEPRVPVFE